jgi:hypothetical protein
MSRRPRQRWVGRLDHLWQRGTNRSLSLCAERAIRVMGVPLLRHTSLGSLRASGRLRSGSWVRTVRM